MTKTPEQNRQESRKFVTCLSIYTLGVVVGGAFAIIAPPMVAPAIYVAVLVAHIVARGLWLLYRKGEMT